MDLSTSYMGIALKNPLIVSSCPLSETLDGIKKLEDFGAAGVVLFSLFEENIRRENQSFDDLMEWGTESCAESLNYFPVLQEMERGSEQYISLLSNAVQATDIPIFGSLNGISNEGWIDYAQQIEQAGASGLELNIYHIPTDLTQSAQVVEQHYLEIVKAVKCAVTIPVAVKLSPFFSATGHFAKQLDELGVNGLVMFNRFFQPDFNLDTLCVDPKAQLGTAEEIRLPLLWIAILYEKINASLAASSGVQSATEAIKYLLAGADVVMAASILMKKGPEYLPVILQELNQWLDAREYQSIEEIRGQMSHKKVANPAEFERVNYLKAISGL